MDLSGKVWLDGQTGLKPVNSPNGYQDSSEENIENVLVELKDNNGVIDWEITDKNGEYSFKDISASVTGKIKYYIEFDYDGINYRTTRKKYRI